MYDLHHLPHMATYWTFRATSYVKRPLCCIILHATRYEWHCDKEKKLAKQLEVSTSENDQLAQELKELEASLQRALAQLNMHFSYIYDT